MNNRTKYHLMVPL